MSVGGILMSAVAHILTLDAHMGQVFNLYAETLIKELQLKADAGMQTEGHSLFAKIRSPFT